MTLKPLTTCHSQPSNILKTRAAHLEQFCSQLEADVDTDSAHKLNEYAVLLTLFGDSRYHRTTICIYLYVDSSVCVQFG